MSRRSASSSLTDDFSSAADTVTVLATAPGHSASKKWVKTGKSVKCINFNAGIDYYVLPPWPVNDIFELSGLLSALERLPNMLVIRGAPRADEMIDDWVRRTGSGDAGNFATPAAGHHWLLIDFDKIPIPRRLSLKRDPVAVCEYLVGLLPKEFHDATYHWQLSSSAGMTKATAVSIHIWFWLSKPIPDPDLKTWAEAVNESHGSKLIDTRLFQHVQAHYTAAPIFEGMQDPFPSRSGLEKKAKDSVDIVLPTKPKVSAKANGSKVPTATAGGSGFEYHLAQIGDHPGGAGFHAPIIAAAASYVATHGEDGTDIEALYLTIRTAVLAAHVDPSKHDSAYVEHMASREHIVPAIESAIRKYGNPPQREQRLQEGVEPYFVETCVPAQEAQQRLQAIVDLI